MNQPEHDAAGEIAAGSRFAFGRNWARFLRTLNEARILRAEETLRTMLETDGLAGRSFLDVGSGSGLFSLAARRLGATVCSFDYDPESVACARELKRRFRSDDTDWRIEQGTVLDADYLGRLGRFDIVYSWGVLHHTGAMWCAMKNVESLVADGGRLYIAIYNDQGRASRQWHRIKQAYNKLPAGLRWLVLWPAFLRLWGPTTLRDLIRGRPFSTWKNYATTRGMSPWRDVVDWVGGLPFEVAKPEEIFDFHRRHGFRLDRLVTCAGGHGCNEFVFTRQG